MVLTSQVFERYWTELRDISQDSEIDAMLDALEMDRDEFYAKIQSQSYKDRLRENTDELIERGGFGSPTIFIDRDDMYFGNDRIPLVMHKVGYDL